MVSQPQYRGDIDGLRAVAVVSVILCHYKIGPFAGGFVGVDIFFVISGFLITSLLRREHAAAGRIDVLAFYARRFRRIVPALAFVLIAVLMAGFFLLMPGDYETTGRTASYAAFGLANINLFWTTGYFDQAAELIPLLHLWSLGVEEQFYLVWPVAFAIALTLAGRRQYALALGILALSVLGMYLGRQELATDPKSAFYLPQFRAWELLAGAGAAFAPQVRNKMLADAITLTGLAAIGWSVFNFSELTPFPGYYAALPVLGATLLVVPRESRIAFTGLGSAPLRAIGLISYSLYLWHWPLWVFYRHYASGVFPDLATSLCLVAASMVMAAISWRFVELPFRGRPAVAIRDVGIGLAAMLALFVGAGVVWQAEGFTGRISASYYGMRSLEAMWEWDCPTRITLDGFDREFCNFGADWDTAGTKALLWGDSHSEHFAPVLEAVLPVEASVTLFNECPPTVGGPIKMFRPDDPAYNDRCTSSLNKAIALLKRDPSINLVVMASSWSAWLPSLFAGEAKLGDMDTGIPLLKAGLSNTIEAISAPGRQILVAGDFPPFPTDLPTLCAVSGAGALVRQPCQPGAGLPRSRYLTFDGPTYAALAELATTYPAVEAIYPGESLCQNEMCDTTVNGEFLYRDASHIRRNLSIETRREIARMIGLEPYLRSLTN